MQQNTEIHAIDQDSDYYPDSLRNIMSPPRILYARGNLDLLVSSLGVAIVGTRNATTNGLKITNRIARHCVSLGATVVSGLALGIDAEAHRGCLDVAGNTIAVLAHGLHTAEPKANQQLGYQILESGGLWVSEHPEGARASRQNFVPRNRIQVGLSKCSIIVESDVRSGTTTHAKFCVQEKHPLFAVIPQEGNPLKLHCKGPEMMVRDMGAKALVTKDDYSLIKTALNL
ncbi:DNA-processing protein DprA [Agarilytica rhodophyticola]|uniref:DNA-processing protein DprA n=1 Tax=Agarilytica rhodophyticola TaxID=1737490 RepID=UPI001315897C|nr:DNA-processing protein DprA [Agarilytica rhodophyticola]